MSQVHPNFPLPVQQTSPQPHTMSYVHLPHSLPSSPVSPTRNGLPVCNHPVTALLHTPLLLREWAMPYNARGSTRVTYRGDHFHAPTITIHSEFLSSGRPLAILSHATSPSRPLLLMRAPLPQTLPQCTHIASSLVSRRQHHWTSPEDAELTVLVRTHGASNWPFIASKVP